jgi:phosphoenolpyruvate carboxykinase (ATP)
LSSQAIDTKTIMSFSQSLRNQGVTALSVLRNASPAVLSQLALQEEREDGHRCVLASTGALIAYSGNKTGRSPLDKRIVEEASSQADVWWGK